MTGEIDIKKIDSGAKSIIDKIQKNGKNAYIVGGCVRDMIMGRNPNDWDITTDMKPGEIESLFEKTIPTGVEHGTVTVILGRNLYEVTTYRIDGEYTDLRRPDRVEFSDRIEDDLSRRDFTVNAMAFNPRDGLIDSFGGLIDIERRMIRCVGDPDKRFNEDALRMMRALRFSAKLGFSIEKYTMKSIYKNAENIKSVSMERINREFEEIIEYDISKLIVLKEISILPWLFLGCDIDYGAIESCLFICSEESMRFFEENGVEKKHIQSLKKAFLFKDEEDVFLKSIMKSMKYSNKEISDTLKLHGVIRNRAIIHQLCGNNCIDEKKEAIKRILGYVDDEKLALAALYSLFDEKTLNQSLCLSVFNDIIINKECYKISQLDINGRDLLENGIAEGKEIGAILEKLLDIVISNPEKNRKDTLLELSKQIGSKLYLEV